MADMQRPWTAFYGTDVRTEINQAPYRTIADLVRSVASTFDEAPAFTTCLPNGMNGALSFRQVDEMSDAFAVYRREIAGLRKGDGVALQMPNCLSFPVAAFGILKAGCVLVNVNPLYTAEEMARQFTDATPSALVIVDMLRKQSRGGNPGPSDSECDRYAPGRVLSDAAEGNCRSCPETPGSKRRAHRHCPFPVSRRTRCRARAEERRGNRGRQLRPERGSR